MNCQHKRLHFDLIHAPFAGSTMSCAVIEITCADCGEPAKFIGLTDGTNQPLDDVTPAMTPSRQTARLPFTIGGLQ